MLTKENIKYFYGLSPLQEGMLFHYLLTPETTANIHQLSYKVAGPLNVEKFQQSWDMIMARHDMLRTSFVYRKVKKPIQVVMKKRPVGFHYEDLRKQSDEEQKNAIRQFKEEDKAKGFDLNKDVLLRISVLQTEDEQYEIIWSYHHIILDGWCMGIIMSELLRFYDQLLRGETPEEKQAISYGEYIRFLARISKSETRQFWRTYLEGYEKQYGFPRKTSDTQGKYSYNAIRKNIHSTKISGLQQLAEQNNVTLNAVIQSIWGLLCMQYNNQHDAIFGFTVSGRNPEIQGVDEIIGLFINTIPVRLQANLNEDITTLFKKAHREAIETQRYHHSSLADILSLSEAGSSLIDHIVVFENFPVDEKIEQEAKGLVNIVDVQIFEHTTYDLAITFIPGQQLQMRIEFNAEAYEDEVISNLADQFEQLIDQILLKPGKPMRELKLISEAQVKELQDQHTASNYPKTDGLATLFEQIVLEHGTREALVFGHETLSYSQLNQRANELAHVLIQRGAQKGTVVALLLERSTDQIASILAVLKTGAAYLPLDPNLPHERLEFMLHDSASVVLLTDQEKVPETIPVLHTSEVAGNDLAQNPAVAREGTDLAYIIYTSGSTGQPKGTLITQQAVTRVVRNTNYIEIQLSDRIGGLSSYAFDGSVFDIFGALLNGAALVLIPKETALDLSRLPALLKSQHVSVLFITTALFNTLVDEGLEMLKGLRKILFGGERVSVPHVRRALDALGSEVLLHVYGPTESTVFATCYPIHELPPAATTVPIGKALSNTQTWILNDQGQLLAKGIPGELYLSGDGLAQAYLNQAELTQKMFVTASFLEGERLYKTGDLVRMLPDGNIEFIGRVDQQVKIRGFRVELGEIETRLLEIKPIREAVVLDWEDTNGSRYLCAYLTSEENLNTTQILEQLAQHLPEYMVPAYAIQVANLPLNANGKVDKKQLPQPNAISDADFEAPQNETQEKLALIWAEVLGLDQVSINESFFRLGGHSLKAMILASRLQQQFEVQVNIADLFTNTTIKAQEKLLSGAEDQTFIAIQPAAKKDFYPLSAAQRRMYFMQVFDPQQCTYNIPFVLRLHGEIDHQKLEQAFQALSHRHEALRTQFRLEEGIPVQVILEETEVRLERIEHEDQTIEQIISKFIRPFDLEHDSLFRLGLCSLNNNENYLLIDLHHIIADGGSLAVLVQDLMALYEGIPLNELNLHYKDYAIWQQDYLQTETAQEQSKAWKHRLGNSIPVLNLPTDFKRPAVQDFSGSTHRFQINGAVGAKFKQFAEKEDLTPFMLLMGIFQSLLMKYSGQEEVIVGTPLSGRTHTDLLNIPGMFVNTLPVKTEPEKQLSFHTYFKQVAERVKEVLRLQNYPFDQLMEVLSVQRDASRNPLFDVLFVFQNNETASFNPGDLSAELIAYDNPISKYDLTLSATETTDGLALSFEYATSLFKPATILRMASHFVRVLEQVLENPNLELGAVQLLSEEEKQEQLEPSADFSAAWPQTETLLSLFEKQVQQTPENAAVVSGEKSLSYAELNAFANQLAGYILAQKNIKPEDKIAILLERNEWILVAILAVLKTGGCYVPIDLAYPMERQEFMLTDSGAVLCIDQAFLDQFLTVKNTYAPENTSISRNPDTLAYIIYTSGSTGQPKGVMIEDRQVVRLLFNERDRFDFSSSDVWTLFHSYCFDFSVWEMYGALLFGGKLVVVPKFVAQSPAEFRELVLREGVTVLNQTPGSFYAFSEQELLTSTADLNLRYVIFGGEALNPLKLAEWRKRYPSVKLINMYGITETTVHVTYKEITETEIAAGISNIGVAIPTLNILILDEQQNLLPIGVAGELCVEGAGLARGYLNRPDLTDERFPTHPFKTGERIYRSGDLARWLPNGELEYLGRIDHQVKIRGFRIELGEIESALLKHPQVQSAVVLDQTDEVGDRFLAAWIVFKSASLSVSIEGLRAHLAETLPDYMIPAFFVTMEQIPLTGNGKVDRKALPNPKTEAMLDTQYVAPRNEAEQALAEVWEQTLGLSPIGIHTGFFEVGGDSIKAIQIASRLLQRGYKLEIKQLFRYPSIAELAPHLKQLAQNQEVVRVTGVSPLTPTQHWFFDQQFNQPEHWNQSLMFFSSIGFDSEGVKQVLDALIQQHDGLRQRFVQENGRWMVHYAESDQIDFQLEDLRELNHTEELISEKAAAIQANLDLAHQPIKACLFKTQNGDHLLIAAHHLLTDGVTWRILMEDIRTWYEEISAGKRLTPMPKTSSYKQWAESLIPLANTYLIQKQLPYWKSLSQTTSGILPKRSEQAALIAGSENYVFELDKLLTERLLNKANKAYQTQIDDLLLCALALTMKDLTGNAQTLITLESHGRENLIADADITRTAGWFTSIYPALLQPGNSLELRDQIRGVKESLRQIPMKGVGFGILRYLKGEELQIQPEISFNYLGQFDQDFKTDGPWKISPLSAGTGVSPENQRTSVLDITGMVANESLSFTISWHPEQLNRALLESFAELYRNYLAQIVEHCCSVSETTQSPGDFELAQLSITEFDHLNKQFHRKGFDIEDLYPLTPMQEGMLFHSITDPQGGAYFEQAHFELKGAVDPDNLEKSLEWCTLQHPILRTRFIYQDLQTPHQVVIKQAEIDFSLVDISDLDAQTQDERFNTYLRIDRQHGFDLSNDPLMRLLLVRFDAEHIKVIWSHHHILMDGWCIARIIQDFIKAYGHFDSGKTPQWAAPAPYHHYLAWLADQDRNQAEKHWKNYLDGYEETAHLPYHKGENTYASGRHLLELSTSEFENLKNRAADAKVTINSWMQTLWGITLQRYNRSNDVVFGSVVSGRPPEIEGVEEMIGLFINTIPVRVHHSDEESFEQVVQRVQLEQIENGSFDFFPLAEIQANTIQQRELIQQVLVFENYPIEDEVDHAEQSNAMSISGFNMSEHTNYPLTLVFVPGKKFTIKWEYNAALFFPEQIEELSTLFYELLKSSIERPAQRVSTMNWMSEELKQKLVKLSVSESKTYAAKQSVYAAFKIIAQQRTEALAVREKDQQIDFAGLLRLSDQIAAGLHANQIGIGDIVAVKMERGVMQMALMLALFKIGAVYLPIDSQYPKDRIEYMLLDAKAKLLIANTNETYPLPCIVAETLIQEHTSVDLLEPKPELAAYLIYTSGSTGKPKGVLVAHQQILNNVWGMIDRLQFKADDCITGFASIAFDAAIMEQLAALLCGGSIYQFSRDEINDAEQFTQVCQKQEISILHLPPAYLALLDEKRLPDVRLVITAGEPARYDDVLRFAPIAGYVNAYGPTEASVCSTLFEVNPYHLDSKRIPIGKTLPNVKTYVLDQQMNPVPIGVAGELAISGAGVALGYLNRDELNREKFVSNPFEANERMYLTGDLVKLQPDGNLLFLGRIDQQIKIRGYRIEPGEIEFILRKTEGINDAVVYDLKDASGEKVLCAWFTGTADPKALKAELARYLPKYMVPDYLVALEIIPISANGKVDRKSLPQPELGLSTASITPPFDDLERKLLELWKELLPQANFGVTDSFFNIGGHSLLMIRMMARVQLQLGKQVDVSLFLQNPSIRVLASLLRHQNEGSGMIDQLKSDVLSFGNPDGKPIFLFPPMAAFSMLYQDLSKHLDHYAIHAFNYLGGHFDPDKYVSRIREIQPEGPYILGGYSIGGNLAHHVASALQRHGKLVSDVILIDSTFRAVSKPAGADILENNAREFLNQMDEDSLKYLENQGLTNMVLSKLQSYLHFAFTITDYHPVTWNLHLIRSEAGGELAEESAGRWKQIAGNRFMEHQGTGEHSTMLEKDYLEQNVKVIQQILLNKEINQGLSS